MKNTIHNIIAINLGLLFATGLAISGMTKPQNIIDFLDVTGNWNPLLLLVMAGAILVYMPAYYLVIKKKDKPLLDEEFFIPPQGKVDKQLIIGSILFGTGWGISGFCPGPALTSFLINTQAIVLVFSLIAGMFLAKFALHYKNHCCKK
ncbi:MAG: YeeE/YedE family protein [Bdellovibrionaceae bacterium]|nr:YeeE/YedE family protein [Pseudobdellovibrionaceae bacterium]